MRNFLRQAAKYNTENTEVQEIRNLLKNLTCMTTDFSVYPRSSQPENILYREDIGYVTMDHEAIYIPYSDKGSILEMLENKRRIIHFLSHGIYLDNTPVGKGIFSLYNEMNAMKSDMSDKYDFIRNGFDILITSTDNLINEEGFCTLMEVDVMNYINSDFSKQLFAEYFESNDIYGQGFKKMRAIEMENGMHGVIDFMMNGNHLAMHDIKTIAL